MSFEHLPPGWAERPLADAAVFADAVDLLADSRSRQQSCLFVVVCDDQGRMVTPIGIQRWRYTASPLEQGRTLSTVFTDVARHGYSRFVLIIARTGQAAPTGDDEQFAAVMRSVAAAAPARVDGIAIATPEGVWACRGADLAARYRVGVSGAQLSA